VKQDRRVNEDRGLEWVYRQHGDRLWWAVLAFAGDREVASDAVAEAFAQALRRGDAIRSPIPWIWRAAFRIAAGELKRRSRVNPVQREESYELPEPAGDVIAALGRLSARQRSAVILHYYADYSLKEVASILGSSPATVAVHLHRGRKRLRELLGDEHE
jgi:RNA polymerase sigma-70 factor (ECF subfamily)